MTRKKKEDTSHLKNECAGLSPRKRDNKDKEKKTTRLLPQAGKMKKEETDPR